MRSNRKRKRTSIKVDGTFDIECASWDKFVVGVTHHRIHGTVAHRSARAMADRMLELGGTWFSHNGGTYDSLCMVEEMRSMGVSMSISLSGSRISRAMGGGLVMCDSYALIPLGLSHAAQLAGCTSDDLGWPCECGRACGGYCAIRTTLPDGKMRELTQYCVSDCVTLMAALDALRDFADLHDYDLRGTIGGSSWATARRWLDLPDADFAAATWKRIRSAYHGGRIGVFRPVVRGRGRHWDIGSAYPAALQSTALPVGEPTELGGRHAREALAAERPGVYSCTITVPECHLPPLPWPGRGGLAYPVGYVSGTWPLPEIHAALERGCDVDDVSWAVIWPASERVFSGLMSAWMGTRFGLEKESAQRAWMRLFANSLTGKLAESPERRFVRLHPPLREIRWCAGTPPCRPGPRGCRCDAYKQIDRWGELWSVPYYRQATSGHVHWAAYLTAVTRIAWLTGAESQGQDLVYGDTDSIWTTSRKRPPNHGDRLGQWSLKHGWSDWECAAPKSYAFTDDTGERVIRSAGIHLARREWDEGNAVQDRGVVSLIEAAARSRGLFRAKAQRWTRPQHGKETGWYADRVLDTLTGVTHPVSVHEIRQKQGSRGTQESAPHPPQSGQGNQ